MRLQATTAPLYPATLSSSLHLSESHLVSFVFSKAAVSHCTSPPLQVLLGPASLAELIILSLWWCKESTTFGGTLYKLKCSPDKTRDKLFWFHCKKGAEYLINPGKHVTPEGQSLWTFPEHMQESQKLVLVSATVTMKFMQESGNPLLKKYLGRGDDLLSKDTALERNVKHLSLSSLQILKKKKENWGEK